MKDLVPVHGGLSEPVDRHVTLDRIREFEKEASAAPTVIVDDADLSSVYRFGDGALSPLTGPMNHEAWHRSLDEGVYRHDGKSYAWTIPISLPVSEEQGKSLKSGQTAQLNT